MTITVQCGSCRKRLAAPEKFAGRKVKCPQCGTILRIPEPEPAPVPQITDLLDDYAPAPSPAPASRAATAADSASAPESAADPSSACPACGTALTPGSMICFGCGYDRRCGKKRELTGPKETSRKIPWVQMAAVVGTLLSLVVFGFIGYALMQPQGALQVATSGITETPTEFRDVRFGDDDFCCDYPKDWKMTFGGGRKGVPPWAKFEQGGASVSIRDSFSGTLDGALKRSMHTGNDIERGQAPVRVVHEDWQDNAAETLRNYQESGPQPLDHLLGEALVSEFRAQPMLGGPVHGYRITILYEFHQFRIVCRCTASEWEILRPAFDHVIASLKPFSKLRGFPGGLPPQAAAPEETPPEGASPEGASPASE